MKGLVVKNTGSWYIVECEDGSLANCKIKGNFRIKGIRTTNPVAVGDRVVITQNGDDSAFITSIEPRRNYIIRRASNLSKESHIIASNIDQAFLIVSFKEPLTSTTFIDRFLATSEAYRVDTILVINKIDILDADEIEYAEAVKNLYETIGYGVVMVSAKTGEGISELQKLMKDKTTLFSGNSGVGKSTIINCILPDLNIKTGDVSTTHHTGMHTTTFSQMYRLESGGYLIDTPGVKGFGTIDFKSQEVAHYFPEIFKISENCKYNNCTHTHEPGCAVLKAVEEAYISGSRYSSYLSIMEDSSEDKYRKAF
ncbi:MAG: ribosome small subunit-dependent GTPase A [Muribaculaceae bacterium]|nr:ribosome small subunit-dependent GTPase A [Muribaculaceae bacterium]